MKDSVGKKQEIHSRLHIGMRKLKSLLALLIGFFIWQAIRLLFPDLEIHPIFIYIYSFLEIRDTSEKTKTFGTQRIKATFVAIAVGMPMLLLRVLIHSHIESQVLVTALDLVLLLVGSLATLQLGEKTKCESMTGLAAVIYIILLISQANDNRYLYAVLRVLQTGIGVFVAWLVNVVLFPYHGKESAEEKE